jgi:ribulose-5-phosphate 4-epimerase/fuculose-1-phosphate aldolase
VFFDQRARSARVSAIVGTSSHDGIATMAEPASITAPTDVRKQVSAEEWAVRQDLAAAYRLVALYGWDDMIFTHLSARVPGNEPHFLINPYGFLFDEITASSLVKIDLDGNVVLDNGYRVNAAGFTIHSAIHMARKDAHAVMHLHTDAGVAVSCMKEGLLPLNQTALLVSEDVAQHEYEGVALELDERERLTADLGGKNAMLLWNHGTLAVGHTVGECFIRMYYLERACAIQVKALAGSGLHMPSQQSVDATTRLGAMPGMFGMVSTLAWPALRRKLDRLDRSYQH